MTTSNVGGTPSREALTCAADPAVLDSVRPALADLGCVVVEIPLSSGVPPPPDLQQSRMAAGLTPPMVNGVPHPDLPVAQPVRPQVALLPPAPSVDAVERLRDEGVAVLIVGPPPDRTTAARLAEAGAGGFVTLPTSADALGVHLDIAIARLAEVRRLRRERDDVARVMETRKLVERAKGVLMARFGLSEPEAHRRLQRDSQHSRVPLAELARNIISTDGGPRDGPP